MIWRHVEVHWWEWKPTIAGRHGGKVPEQETNEEEEDCSTGKRSAYFLERKQAAGRRGRRRIEMATDSEIVVPCYHGTVLDKKKKRPVLEALSANRNTAESETSRSLELTGLKASPSQ